MGLALSLPACCQSASSLSFLGLLRQFALLTVVGTWPIGIQISHFAILLTFHVVCIRWRSDILLLFFVEVLILIHQHHTLPRVRAPWRVQSYRTNLNERIGLLDHAAVAATLLYVASLNDKRALALVLTAVLVLMMSLHWRGLHSATVTAVD